MDDIWPQFSKEPTQHAYHSGVGQGRVEWLVRVDVQSGQHSAPARDAVNRNRAIHLGPRAGRTGQRHDIHFMPPTGELVGEQLDL
jgi:hypothetical protein